MGKKISLSERRKKKRTISKRYLRPRWAYLSQTKRGILTVKGWMITELAEKYGTPLYIFVEDEIRDRLRRFKNAFPYEKLVPQYACKCNSNLEILKIVREEGFELDASSVGEIILGLLADFEPHQITFTNLYKSEQDIMFAAKVGVQAITIDSLEELKKIADIAGMLNQEINIFIRVNPIITLGAYSTKEHQYGIPYHKMRKAIDFVIENKHLVLRGFHFHGSYISNPKVYTMAAKRLLKLAKYCQYNNMTISTIDLGGGFPVEYGSKKVFQPEDMGNKFVKSFKRMIANLELHPPKLIFEPGKFIVATAGIGIVKVISVKKIGRNMLVVTDGSTYSMLPDPLIYHCYYDILPATKMRQRRWNEYTICGCTCDSIDRLGEDRWLPNLVAGDILAIMDCGAYSNVMASNFNNLKRPPMIMIKEAGKTIKLVRRRDRYSEMFAPELDVLKVAGPKELKDLYNMYRVNINKIWGAKQQLNGVKKK